MSLGATITLNSVENYVAAVARFVESLSSELQETVRANLYYSPGGTPSFDEHFDSHDIFIVQLEGEKQWTMKGGSHEYPLESQDYFDYQPPSDKKSEILSVEPGQALYIPRGCWHRAVSNGPSLHLSVGVYRQTRADLASWLIEQLIEDVEMRRDAFSLITGDGVESSLLEIEKAIVSLISNKQGLAAKFRARRERAIADNRVLFSFPEE